MEIKKSKSADLEKGRPIYFIFGLLLSVAISYSAIEYRSYTGQISDLGIYDVGDQDILELPPILRFPKKVKQLVPISPKPSNKLKITNEPIPDPKDVLELPDTISIWDLGVIDEPGQCLDCDDPAPLVPFVRVEKMPTFPGCEDEPSDQRDACTYQRISQHVMENYKHPRLAIEHCIKGKVYVKFVIAVDGSVTDLTILKTSHKILNDAVTDAIKSLPAMNPGRQMGKNVPVYYTLPVNISY